MVQFKDHITGDVLMTAENGEFESDELFFKFRANYIQVIKTISNDPQTVVDVIWNGQMKKFDLWRVEKDIFDYGQKLGELVETKMCGDDADFTYMVDYIFNLRAWFRANRETKDMKVYIGPSSTYMSHAYVRNFTPVFVKEEDGIPYVYLFKETVHAEGLIEDKMKKMSINDNEEEVDGEEEKATTSECNSEKTEESEKEVPTTPEATTTAQ